MREDIMTNPTEALLEAAHNNHSNEMIQALEAGGDPNAQQKKTGQTPLMLAINAAHEKDDAFNLDGIAALITDPKTDLSIRDKGGKTALDHAKETVFQTSIVPAIEQAQSVQSNNFVSDTAQRLKEKYRGGPAHHGPKRKFG